MNKPMSQMHESMRNTFLSCFDISVRKNRDYASIEDPYKNFKLFSIMTEDIDLGACDKTEIAMIVRLCDKFQRIVTLIGKEPDVTDEKMSDTIQDAINYLAILKAWREKEKPVCKMLELEASN